MCIIFKTALPIENPVASIIIGNAHLHTPEFHFQVFVNVGLLLLDSKLCATEKPKNPLQNKV